jgi:uncharacterized protein YbjT (DUF2867 family)
VTILITGATGKIGRHLVDDLLATGHRLRALTRDQGKVSLPAAVEVVQGDLTVPATWPAALDGVERVYLFPVLESIQEFVRAARGAGVRRIVFLSGSWAAGETERDRQTWTYPQYRAAEAAVEGGGLDEWTILRPGPFATNLLWWARSIREQCVVRAPYGAAVCPLIHEADIAAVAALALTQDGHVGARYTLTGPKATSQVEQAAMIGRAIGHEIRFDELTADQWRESVSPFLRPGIIADLLRYWSETASDPSTALPALPTVERLTGRPARTMTQWAEDHVRDFSHPR